MLFSNLPIAPEIAVLLQKHGTPKSLKTGEALVQVNEQCSSVYFVLTGGFLRRFYNEHAEIFRTISFHLPNHRPFLTVNESYFTNQPSNYEIKAFQSSTLLEFKRTLIEEVNQEYPLLQEFYRKQIINSLLYESDFKSRLITYSSKDFYNYLCDSFPEIIRNVPSKYIAEVMRISPEWLSKLKSKS